MSYSFTQLLWLFFIYGFAGWCVEVIFHAANKGIFINRGFLIGPICPIYGYGLVAVLSLIHILSIAAARQSPRSMPW